MDDLRAITNDHRDVRLVSLRRWKGAGAVEPRDDAGPYMVSQDGFDPSDPAMVPAEYILGRSGAWLRVEDLLRLPREERQREFIFGTAAEVLEVMMGLRERPVVLRADGREAAPADDDGLAQALARGQGEDSPPVDGA